MNANYNVKSGLSADVRKTGIGEELFSGRCTTGYISTVFCAERSLLALICYNGCSDNYVQWELFLRI